MLNSLKSLLVLTGLVMVLGPSAGNAQNLVALTAEFSGQTSQGESITIKQGPGEKWTVEKFIPCKSYPCDVKSQTLTTTVTPAYRSSPNLPDGNTVIELNEGMVLTFVNNGMVAPKPDGTREESYWKLEAKRESGAVVTVRLTLTPKLQPVMVQDPVGESEPLN